MKTVRRLLYREILGATVFVMAAFLGLFFFIDLVDELDGVGRGGRNRPIDVAIVQHLLSVHYRGNSLVDILPPNGVADADLEAMLEERRKKKDQKKEAPAFAFTKAGDVFRLPATSLLDQHEEKAKDVDAGALELGVEKVPASLGGVGGVGLRSASRK